jgi:predicted nucleic acid-binding protein
MKSDNNSFFVDANVLVYAAVRDDDRNKAAKELLKDSSRGMLHISPQSLTEFYSTITSSKRVTAPYAPVEAVEFIETLLEYEHVFVLPISQDVPSRLLALLWTNSEGPTRIRPADRSGNARPRVTKLFTYVVPISSTADLELFGLRTKRIRKDFRT